MNPNSVCSQNSKTLFFFICTKTLRLVVLNGFDKSQLFRILLVPNVGSNRTLLVEMSLAHCDNALLVNTKINLRNFGVQKKFLKNLQSQTKSHQNDRNRR